MKKLLLASTALAMTAGAAAAEVTLSGSASMGLIDESGTDGMFFHNDTDVKFTLSGETSNGVSFGATIDLDEVSGGIPDNTGPDSVYVSGSFGTVTLGDTDGAFDWAMTETAFGSSLRDVNTSHAGFSGNSGLDGTIDAQVLRYDYSFGDFAFAVSAEIGGEAADAVSTSTVSGTGTGATTVTGTLVLDGEVFGIGLKYAMDYGSTSVSFGIGYQEHDSTAAQADIIGVSVGMEFAGGFMVGVNYSELDVSVGTALASGDHTSIALGYETGALLLSANYGVYDYDTGAEDKGWAVTANYDLGGGATLTASYADSDTAGTTGDGDVLALGAIFSF